MVRDRRVRRAVLVVAAGVVLTMCSIAAILVVPPLSPPPQEAKAATTAPVWTPTGTVGEIPPISYLALVQASQGSEKVAGCYVSWTMLGGVMGIESGYGTFGDSMPDPATGQVAPPIFGPPIDGRPGFDLIYNDDYGRSLGVVGVYAKAVGPTQFLPSTWAVLGRDGNGDGVADPQNIFDAAMSTAAYLCAHGYVEGDLARTSTAIFRYNPSTAYVAAVLGRAAALVEEAAATPAPGAVGSLVTVGGITVDASIAGQLGALLAAAAADGIVFGGYGHRSYQTQVDLRRAHCGTSDYAIYQMDSGSCSPPTARPGFSLHEKGLAIDFYAFGDTVRRGTRADAWLLANAGRFGLINLPSEAWHYSTTGA